MAENKPSRYKEYKVLETEREKDGSFKITEKKPTGKIKSIYPHEADIMNNGHSPSCKTNERAANTKRWYELVEEEEKKPRKSKSEEPKETIQ